MASTGLTFPGVGTTRSPSGSISLWSNPANILADDNAVASTSQQFSVVSNNLVAKQFGFNIGSATVLGVTVQIGGSAVATQGVRVQLRTASQNILVGTSKVLSITSTSEATYTLGGATDLWGSTLTASDINSAEFGVEIWLETGVIMYAVSIDWIKVSVEYEAINSSSLNAISSTYANPTLNGSVFNTAKSYADIKTTIGSSARLLSGSSIDVRYTLFASAIENTSAHIQAKSTLGNAVGLAGSSSIHASPQIGLSQPLNAASYSSFRHTLAASVFGNSWASMFADIAGGSDVHLLSSARVSAYPYISPLAKLNGSVSIYADNILGADITLTASTFLYALPEGTGLVANNASAFIDATPTIGSSVAVSGSALLYANPSVSSVVDMSGSASNVTRSTLSSNVGIASNGHFEIPTSGMPIEWQCSANLTSASSIYSKPSIGSDVYVNANSSSTAQSTIGSQSNINGIAYIYNEFVIGSEVILTAKSHTDTQPEISTKVGLTGAASTLISSEGQGIASLDSRFYLDAKPSIESQVDIVSRGYVETNATLGVSLFLSGSVSSVFSTTLGLPTGLTASASLLATISSQAEAKLTTNASIEARPTLYGGATLTSVASFSASGIGGVPVDYGIRSPRFGILGIPFGSFNFVSGQAYLDGNASLNANGENSASVILNASASLTNDYELIEAPVQLNAISYMIAVPEPIYELCPCPEYEQEQTTIMTTEHGGDVVACTINRKGCD